MKKYLLFFSVVLMLILFLFGCEEERKAARIAEKQEDFLIVAEESGIGSQTAQYISACLSDEGYSSKICTQATGAEGFLGVIAVGDSTADFDEAPVVRCRFKDCEGEDENVIAPSLSSKNLARAAVLLLPNAEHFSVISEAQGATDVQDACDFLDVSGVDYTVETLDGRAYGDAVITAAQKGCDVLLLPFRDTGAVGVELSPYDAAVIAVGDGEPVRGALASFCIDTESLAAAAASLALSLALGEEAEFIPESYYSLCISESVAAEFEIDIEAVSEDFRVVMVE